MVCVRPDKLFDFINIQDLSPLFCFFWVTVPPDSEMDSCLQTSRDKVKTEIKISLSSVN